MFTVTFLRNLLPDPCHKMKVSHTKNTAFMKALRELRILLNVEILTRKIFIAGTVKIKPMQLEHYGLNKN